MRTTRQVQKAVANAKVSLVDLSHYSEALGVNVPKVQADKVGEFKLHNFLRDTVGAGFKNHPIGSRILADFNRSVLMSKRMR